MKDDNKALIEQFSGVARPVITVDVEKYQQYLDGSGLSEDQKEEYLEAMWAVVVAFVELGFGVHPLQDVCGDAEGNEIAHENRKAKAVKELK